MTSAYSSYSGCRQYLNNIQAAQEATETTDIQVDKVRSFYNHPLFVEAQINSVRAELDKLSDAERAQAHIAFCAHSIPMAMHATCDYQQQLLVCCEWVASALGHEAWQLVYQSRSGPPQVPWLEPDIVDHLEELAQQGIGNVIVVPIGFVCDHMEVVWDLDREAKDKATELGLGFYRAATVGETSLFAEMVRELIQERNLDKAERLTFADSSAVPDRCAPDCCAYTPRRSK